ncbi:MAG: hypothetical protein MSH23_04835 [Campylobacter lanienae]|uniref:hypothetical protein n=1 Tax=Campylobacter lanienae TaxID=75658 RepID=UPI00242DEB01|nr:hypothetical protein [Campylobacter lanienae]MCI7364335.1 hypothetical protein [Campylobacter lanienae]
MRICASFLMLVSTIYSQDLNIKYKYILDLYNKFNTRANLTDISSPFFISQSPQTTMDAPNLNLEAIIENRVKINSKWYEVGKEYDDLYIVEIKGLTARVLHQDQYINLKFIKSSVDVEVY